MAKRNQAADPETQSRRAELAKIHMGATALGLIQKSDDSAYRLMLVEVTGRDSAKHLDHADRAKVLAHLVASGWKERGGSRKAPASRYVRGTKPALIRWLWSQLHKAGLVDHNTELALRRYIAQHAGLGTPKDTITERDPRHLDEREQNHVIEQLKRWLARGNEPRHG